MSFYALSHSRHIRFKFQWHECLTWLNIYWCVSIKFAMIPSFNLRRSVCSCKTNAQIYSTTFSWIKCQIVCECVGLSVVHFELRLCDRFVCSTAAIVQSLSSMRNKVDGCSFRNARKSATPALALIDSLTLHSVLIICLDSQLVAIVVETGRLQIPWIKSQRRFVSIRHHLVVSVRNDHDLPKTDAIWNNVKYFQLM